MMKSRVNKEKIKNKEIREIDKVKAIEGNDDETRIIDKTVEDSKVSETDSLNKELQSEQDSINDKDDNSNSDENNIVCKSQALEDKEVTKTDGQHEAIDSETIKNEDNMPKLPKDFLNGLDFKDLRPPKTKGQNRGIPEAGVMSIINSQSNGKRIMLSKALMDKLNYPESLQFAFYDNTLVIGEKLSENQGSFYIREMSKRPVIYSSQLVKTITDVLGLDFSDRVSITLRDVIYESTGEATVAVIKG